MFEVISDLYNYNLDPFFDSCKRLGYVNNISKKSMRMDLVKERFGNYWGLCKDKQLVAVAGCLEFPEVDVNAYRIQFRGCELPHSDVKKTLSRSHFNSSTFRELIPYQIDWCNKLGSNDLYLTTNLDNKNHKAMQLIAKQGFLTLIDTTILYGVEQAIWRLDNEKYLDERKKLGRYTIQCPPLI